MKTCADCKKKKPLTDFNIRMNYNNTDTIYRFNFCSPCGTIRVKKWQKKNRERYLTYQRNYAKTHKK